MLRTCRVDLRDRTIPCSHGANTVRYQFYATHSRLYYWVCWAIGYAVVPISQN